MSGPPKRHRDRGVAGNRSGHRDGACRSWFQRRCQFPEGDPIHRGRRFRPCRSGEGPHRQAGNGRHDVETALARFKSIVEMLIRWLLLPSPIAHAGTRPVAELTSSRVGAPKKLARVGPTTPKQFLRSIRHALTWQFMHIPTAPWRWGRLKWVPRFAVP